MEFPTTNLYELESRVFTDHWSIPYKREESLGKCLIASTCLARMSEYLRACFFLCVCLANCNSIETMKQLFRVWMFTYPRNRCQKNNKSFFLSRLGWCRWELQEVYRQMYAWGLQEGLCVVILRHVNDVKTSRRVITLIIKMLCCLIVADVKCCAQVGNRDSWGHLQHADAAGGSGRRKSQTRPHTHRPHGSSYYGTHNLLLVKY